MTTTAKIRPQSVRAKIFTDDYEIEGNVHLNPGTYGGRISDLMQAPGTVYIPVTQARCTSRHMADSTPVMTDCTIVNVRKIKMVLPLKG